MVVNNQYTGLETSKFKRDGVKGVDIVHSVLKQIL